MRRQEAHAPISLISHRQFDQQHRLQRTQHLLERYLRRRDDDDRQQCTQQQRREAGLRLNDSATSRAASSSFRAIGSS